ncbi:hypothetical protein ACA910_003486 [Epithemia clementina (nom. ined.)]
MIPLDKLQKQIDATRAKNETLRQQRQELLEQQRELQETEERKEPTLRFAGIKEISENEMEDTKKSLQTDVWMVIQCKTEWLVTMKTKTIQHPKDIQVDKAIIKAEFPDDKILRKLLEQTTEVKTSLYFRQVKPPAVILEIYLKKGHYNDALQAYVAMGQVTTENAPEMLEHALKKAREEADAEIKKIAGMESQGTQDIWWQMFLCTIPNNDPIVIMKLNYMIAKWEQHLLSEIEIVDERRQLRITNTVIQLIKEERKEKERKASVVQQECVGAK